MSKPFKARAGLDRVIRATGCSIEGLAVAGLWQRFAAAA